MDGWLVPILLAILTLLGIAALQLSRAAVRRRLRHRARHLLFQFRARVDRYKLVERERIREALLRDPVVLHAIMQHASLTGSGEAQVRLKVNQYIDEIVPFAERGARTLLVKVSLPRRAVPLVDICVNCT